MKNIIIGAMISICISPAVFAHTAKKEVKKDDTMIKLEKDVKGFIIEKGDYDSALKLYANAARKYTSEPYYKEQYSILRRVIKMKKAMNSEGAELTELQKKKWTSYYLAVRGYYFAQGYYSESLPLDKKACEVLNIDQSKINYLETLVILDKKELAQKFCSEITGPLNEKNTFKTLSLLAMSINGNAPDAIQELIKIDVDPKDDPRSMVFSACIYQINNDHAKACKSITEALENTAPTVIPATRKLIENMKPLQEYLESKKLQAALNTESKVYQSGCTGGSSCNSCSLKDSCPSNQ